MIDEPSNLVTLTLVAPTEPDRFHVSRWPDDVLAAMVGSCAAERDRLRALGVPAEHPGLRLAESDLAYVEREAARRAAGGGGHEEDGRGDA